MIDLLTRLVSVKSVNPPGAEYLTMLDILEAECRALGMECTRYLVSEERMKELGLDTAFPRVNMIARLDLGKEKTIHFNGHYDVVPVTKDWKDAYTLKVDGDKLYGRGTSDMKAGFVCYIFVLRSLLESKAEIPYNIEFSFVCDEETGGRAGMGELAQHISADYAIGEGAMGSWVSIGNKGILWFRITIKGKAAHGAYAYLGVNSFEKMNELVGELIKLKKEVESRKSKYPTETKEEGYGSMTIGGEVVGGDKTNTVPQETSFTIDRRVLPDEKMEDAKKEVLDVVSEFMEKHPEVSVKVEITAEDNAVVVDPDSEFVKKMLSVVSEVTGEKASAKMTAGGTDMRYLIAKGIPSLGYAAYGEDFHADGEWVSLKSMVETAEVFRRVMQKNQG